jgi:MFS family permease
MHYVVAYRIPMFAAMSAEFLAFIQLRFFLAMGWHMQALVVGWYVYALTNDPLMLGMVGLAEAVPAIGLALPMGYLVDGIDKRDGIRRSVLLILLSAVGTALFLHPVAVSMLGNQGVITGLLSMIVVNGAARALYSPSMFSSLGMIVPRDGIGRASAINSTVWQAAMILGPLVGGVIYGQFGVQTASAVFIGTMAIGALGAMRISPKPAVKREKQADMWGDVTQGLRFILSNPVIVSALSLDLFAVFFGGVVALLPVFASTILMTDESGLGILRAAMSVGSVAMMAWLSYRPVGRNAGRSLLISVAGFGCCIIAFGLSTSFWLSVGILVLAGAFDSISVVIRHTILQLHTPDHMKGRVGAANTMFISSSNELGAVESGIAARLMGTVPSVLFGGAMTLLVVTVVAIKNRALRRMHIDA